MASEKNPYVGPRPFERTDQKRFFGRDAEAADLLSLVISQPVVLLYAQSGAGKSSLLNALVIPRLEKYGLDVLPLARVRGEALSNAQTDQIANFYTFHAINSWINIRSDPNQFGRLTIAEFLKGRQRIIDDEGNTKPCVLIFDQFEELFTYYPERWQDQEPFFQQIREALEADYMLRVVFSMREDYIAMLDPFKAILPGKLRTRYRLERLRKNTALLAATAPLYGSGHRFADGVAENLVESLLKIRVKIENQVMEITGEFVEPVHLQVVCQRLWEELADGEMVITEKHLASSGDVDQALSSFYAQSIKEVAEKTQIGSAILQRWFQDALLTKSGTRKIVYRGETETEGLANIAVDVFEDLHLIRGEWRDGSRCYELAHDRFIEPIRTINRKTSLLGDAESASKVTAEEPSKWFFRAGGALGGNTPSYIVRQADNQLLEGLSRGEFCYILEPRQSGKTSVMYRTADILRQNGFRVVLTDLSTFGREATLEQWYYSLVRDLEDRLLLDDELHDYWQKNENIAPVNRFFGAIREFILPMSDAPLIWFIDEIDIIPYLSFDVGDFLAGIRACYNHRVEDPIFARLTFCLMGTCQLQDLIKNPASTPFNIGRRIELNDFTPNEVAQLAQGLEGADRDGRTLLERIFYWTSGHPYQTQRLCEMVSTTVDATSPTDVDHLCQQIFLLRGRVEEVTLAYIERRLIDGSTSQADTLELYSKVLQKHRVPDNPADPLIARLKLSGVVRTIDGYLHVRNRIYQHVFNKQWISDHMPSEPLNIPSELPNMPVEALREYRGRLIRSIATLFLIVALGGLSWIAIYNARQAENRALRAEKQAAELATRLQEIERGLKPQH